MTAPPIADDEEKRLQELDKLEMMLPAPEAALDRLTAELVRIFDVPAAMINLIGRDSQFIKAATGVPNELLRHHTPRGQSLCSHVVGSNEMLVVEDLKSDPRFEGHDGEKHGVRFYAGTPLRCDAGHAVGSLCLVDTKPRKITQREKELLRLIADGVMSEIKLTKASRHLLDRTRLIERDLASARTVQRFLLPPPQQQGTGYIVCHWYHPYDAIGGDFVDVQARADGSVVVLLADVSGHGASAALTSAMTKTVFQRAVPTITRPCELLNALHQELSQVVDSGRFMTAAAAIFDPRCSAALISSAGHPYPLALRNGDATVVRTHNEPPLLVDAEWVYSNELAVPMAAGDRLLMYTDGAIEASDPRGRMLELDGLAAMVRKNSQQSREQFLPELFKEVRQFAHGRLNDDVALVCLERPSEPQ